MKQCNLCGSRSIFHLYDLKTYQVLKCKACGLTFLDQETIKEQPEELYDEEYFTKLHKKWFSAKNNPRLKDFEGWLQQIEKCSQKGRLLDIGCGPGFFLNLAKQSGWDVQGVDISKYAAKHAKDKFNIDVKVGRIENLNLKEKDFDVITLFDFIEHAQNPDVVFSKAYSLLKKRGILFITTDNQESLIVRLANLIYRITNGVVYQPAKKTHPIHHFTLFSEKTIKKYLKKHNFKVAEITKRETPIANIGINFIEKIIVSIIYIFSGLFNQQYEMIIVAKK